MTRSFCEKKCLYLWVEGPSVPPDTTEPNAVIWVPDDLAPELPPMTPERRSDLARALARIHQE